MNTVSSEKLNKLKEKIQLMLNKAENTPYPAEAQTFQEHAERLMVRYGITAAQLDAEAGKGSKSEEKIVEVKFTFKGSFRKQEFAGFGQICYWWPGITLLKQINGNVIHGFIIGHESDVESVVRLLNSLLIQVGSARTNWWKSVRDEKAYMSQSEKYLERRTYTLAWMRTVARRFKDLFAEETAAAGTGTDLVLVNRQDKVNDWVGEQYPSLRMSRGQLQEGSYDSARAGAVDGSRADLGLGDKLDKANRGQLV